MDLDEAWTARSLLTHQRHQPLKSSNGIYGTSGSVTTGLIFAARITLPRAQPGLRCYRTLAGYNALHSVGEGFVGDAAVGGAR